MVAFRIDTDIEGLSGAAEIIDSQKLRIIMETPFKVSRSFYSYEMPWENNFETKVFAKGFIEKLYESATIINKHRNIAEHIITVYNDLELCFDIKRLNKVFYSDTEREAYKRRMIDDLWDIWQKQFIASASNCKELWDLQWLGPHVFNQVLNQNNK